MAGSYLPALNPVQDDLLVAALGEIILVAERDIPKQDWPPHIARNRGAQTPRATKDLQKHAGPEASLRTQRRDWQMRTMLLVAPRHCLCTLGLRLLKSCWSRPPFS